MAADTQVWTDVGQQWATDCLDPATRGSVNDMKWLHWGSGTTAADVTDTALGSAHPESRTSGTTSQPSANTMRVTGTITATGSRTVEEYGLFDASTSGNMGSRMTRAALTLNSGDEITVTVNVAQADSSE